jgi:hypothetical protein
MPLAHAVLRPCFDACCLQVVIATLGSSTSRQQVVIAAFAGFRLWLPQLGAEPLRRLMHVALAQSRCTLLELRAKIDSQYETKTSLLWLGSFATLHLQPEKGLLKVYTCNALGLRPWVHSVHYACFLQLQLPGSTPGRLCYHGRGQGRSWS